MIFQKIDLLTPEAMASFTTKEGDIIDLVQPPHTPGKDVQKYLVEKVETFKDAGVDPLSGAELTRVILTLTEAT